MQDPGQEDVGRQVAAFITSFFEAGKEKEITSLMDFHGPARLFTKFDENPPYTRQSSEEAFVHEQAAFANISDYEYKIEDLRVDLVGGVAIATFYLSFKGMFVNDYSFEGMTVGSRSRVTMVVAKVGESWKIVHAHFSQFPDLPKKEPGK
ncbi:MAG: nuclear transport factor 2 family protein [Nitrososphaerota archaeon]|nr:nuclear transport factor 2 family protein [Nitrososphaerota archaeon]